jgi:TatA/E family protein of Tat protein translocase
VFGLGLPEIILILVVALLVLGPKRLPEAARSLGRGLAEFRRASTEIRGALTMETPPEAPAKSIGKPPETRSLEDEAPTAPVREPGASAVRDTAAGAPRSDAAPADGDVRAPETARS